MTPLVTIGIPVYKRLEYLPHVLDIVAAQDYPNIDLLVSDNGMNGTAVQSIVRKHYPKPYRFRQNAATVSASNHFTQLIHNAMGEYYVMLADDDEISANYISELVGLLERHPQASAALALEETIDDAGNVMKRSKDTVPEIMSGPDFIRSTWGTHEYGYRSLCTFLARTDKLKECGGFPDIWAATSDEDLLMVKLCIDNFIVVSTRCAFRKRFDEASMGYAIEIEDLARGIKEYLQCLDSDPKLLNYAASHRVEWQESRKHLIDSAWRTYFYRWKGLYKKRLSSTEWAKAAFGLPFIPAYYRAVARTFISPLVDRGKKHLPWAYKIYRSLNPKHT
jgi:glycosyltransferase involved in cell wall biosynthesis